MDRGGGNLHYEADRSLHCRSPSPSTGHNAKKLSVGEVKLVGDKFSVWKKLICTNLGYLHRSDPMRITKKFAGSNGIGKQIFAASPETEKTVEVRRAIMQEIGELEQRFRKRIDYSMAAAPLSLSSFGNLDGGPVEPVCFNSYRVHIPNDDVPPPFASNAELVKFLNLRKDVFSVAEPRGGQVQSEPLYSVASQMKRLLKPEVDSPVYVDENYRVHGFQPVFVKKEAAKVEVQANFKERVPFKPKPEIKLEGSAAFVKQPKLPKPPKEPKEPKAAMQPSSLKAKSDPIQDLQASALLLDFFRSAMMKEVAEDSEGSHSDLADEIAPKRTKLV